VRRALRWTAEATDAATTTNRMSAATFCGFSIVKLWIGGVK
jgi:hypothetical protein